MILKDKKTVRFMESMTDSVAITNTKVTNHRHCEERSDEAIHNKMSLLDCFAALANVSSTESMTDSVAIANTKATNHRHCEERSDEAIHNKMSLLDCFVALAMTLFVTIITAVPKGRNFHNRRSSTCGTGAHHNLCPKGRTYRLSKSCLSGSLPDIPCRRSMTCGYENYVPSGLSVVARTMALTSVFAFFSFGTKRIFANASSTESMTDAVVFANTNVAQTNVNHNNQMNHTNYSSDKMDAVVFADTNTTPLAPHFQFSIFN